jgi:hypothetical protein
MRLNSLLGSPIEKKLPDPFRKAWDRSAATKSFSSDTDCLCGGRPFSGRAFVFPGQNQIDPLWKIPSNCDAGHF